MKAQQAGSRSEVRKSRSRDGDGKRKTNTKNKSKNKTKSRSTDTDEGSSGKVRKNSRAVIRKRRQRDLVRSNHKKTILNKTGIMRVIDTLGADIDGRNSIRITGRGKADLVFLAEHFAKNVISKASLVSRNEGPHGSVVLMARHFKAAGVSV